MFVQGASVGRWVPAFAGMTSRRVMTSYHSSLPLGITPPIL